MIEQKIRQLTALSSENALPSLSIQQLVNTFYNQDFPYTVKMDQLRSVYKFLTIPNVDRYPVDVNSYQGFRAPVYFGGVQGNIFKNRDQLFNLYPRYPAQYQHGVETLSGEITGIAQPTNPAQITSPDHNLSTGAIIQIIDVGGMVQLNNVVFTVTVIDANNFTLDGIDNAAYGAYTGGGSWISSNTSLSFNLFGNTRKPFPQPNLGILSTQVVIGGVDINNNPIRIIDDGGAVTNVYGIGSNTTVGRLLYITQNTVGNNVYLDSAFTQQTAIPPLSPLAILPKTSPPSPLTPQYCGTVDYITTEINLTLPVPVMPGTMLNILAVSYNPGRPCSLLFWNNEITIRPIPDKVYEIEVEAYQTPVQFLQSTDNPALNQWWQYIAYGVAVEILRTRQDMEGVQNLMEGFKRQEAMVIERQSIEEINQPNITLFNTTQTGYGYGVGMGY